MRSWFNNPIAYAFCGIALVLLLSSLSFGVNLADYFQLLFAPYTYDMSRGVGDTLASIIATGLLVIQILLVLMIVSLHKMESVPIRRTLWGFGVVVGAVYFVVTTFGCLISNFH